MIMNVVIALIALAPATTPANRAVTATHEFVDARSGIVAMNLSPRTGDKVSFMLLLPPRSDAKATWEFYYGSAVRASAQGDLASPSEIKLVSVVVDAPGKFAAVLILRGVDGMPRETHTAVLDVHDTALPPSWSWIIGILAGASTATLAFLIQDAVKLRHERQKRRETMRNSVLAIVGQFAQMVTLNQSFDVPAWLISGEPSEWSYLLFRTPYSEGVKQLQRLANEWAARTKSQEEMLTMLSSLTAGVSRWR